MERKRVLFVLNAPGGGATQGIKEYLKFQNDIDAYLVLPSKPNSMQEQWINQYSKGYFICKMPWWNLPNGMPLIYKKLLHWKNNRQGNNGEFGAERIADIIKANSIDYVYTGSILIREGAIAAKKTGVKHIWHIKETFGFNGRVKFELSDKELQEFILSHSEYVICMTKYIKSFFNYVNNSPKLRVIHDGIDPSLFLVNSKIKRIGIRDKYGIAEGEILIGMVASLSSIWKNHLIFIQAAALLKKNKNIRFIAFGPEPQKKLNPIYNTGYLYFKSLKKEVINSKLQDRFIWAGFFEDIPAIFQGLDVFVHPCASEPFGRVVIEAMASGVSVIVPDSGGASEPVKELEIGYMFESNNEKDLARVIQEVINSNYDRSFNRNFITLSESSYSLDSYSKFINQLFE